MGAGPSAGGSWAAQIGAMAVHGATPVRRRVKQGATHQMSRMEDEGPVGCACRRGLLLREDDRGGGPPDLAVEGAGESEEGHETMPVIFPALVVGHGGDLALGGDDGKSRPRAGEVVRGGICWATNLGSVLECVFFFFFASTL